MTNEHYPPKRSRLERIFGFFERMTGRSNPVAGGTAYTPLPEEIEARERSARESGAKPPPKQPD